MLEEERNVNTPAPEEQAQSAEPAEETAQETPPEDKPAELREQESKTRRTLQRSERSVKEYQYFLIRLAVLVLLIWVLFFKIVGLTTMPSGDMYPRLDLGDLLLYYRLDTDVRAQDIVVFEKTTPDTKQTGTYVARVVAVEGDTVEVTDEGTLKINGNTMIESNIFYRTMRYEGYTEYPLTLGEGQCFVLVDHRDGGADSRYFGPVEKSELLGTVITVVRRNAL